MGSLILLGALTLVLLGCWAIVEVRKGASMVPTPLHTQTMSDTRDALTLCPAWGVGPIGESTERLSMKEDLPKA